MAAGFFRSREACEAISAWAVSVVPTTAPKVATRMAAWVPGCKAGRAAPGLAFLPRPNPSSSWAAMAFPDRLKLPLAFDPGRLARDLAALAAVPWTPHFVPQNYDGDWSVIALRAAKGAAGRHPIRLIYSDPTATEFEDTAFMDACPYFREVAGAFGAAQRSVRLMRLAPGSVIKEHNDGDLSAEGGTVRIHAPVTTNPDVVFELNRRRVDMAPGEAWYLRLSDPHRVANRGTTDRVHLVIDLAMNPALQALLERATAEAAAG